MSRTLHVTLAGGYWLHSYKRLLIDLGPLLSLRRPAKIIVDMRRLTFMGPAALATAAAALTKTRDSGYPLKGSQILLPRAPGINRYLHRMDFFRVLFHEPDLPDPSDRDADAGLLECQHFTADEQLRGVTKAMLAAVEKQTQLGDTARYALDTCLSELFENVIFHAYTPHGGMAAAQTFKRELELAIVDLGVGISSSLARNPDYAELAKRDDLTAVRTALVPNVTSTPDRNRGWGLAFTEQLLRLNGGRLIVRSGAGHVQRGAKDVDKLDTVPLPGTLVAMRIQIDRPLDYSRAWDRLGKIADAGTVVPP